MARLLAGRSVLIAACIAAVSFFGVAVYAAEEVDTSKEANEANDFCKAKLQELTAKKQQVLITSVACVGKSGESQVRGHCAGDGSCKAEEFQDKDGQWKKVPAKVDQPKIDSSLITAPPSSAQTGFTQNKDTQIPNAFTKPEGETKVETLKVRSNPQRTESLLYQIVNKDAPQTALPGLSDGPEIPQASIELPKTNPNSGLFFDATPVGEQKLPLGGEKNDAVLNRSLFDPNPISSWKAPDHPEWAPFNEMAARQSDPIVPKVVKTITLGADALISNLLTPSGVTDWGWSFSGGTFDVAGGFTPASFSQQPIDSVTGQPIIRQPSGWQVTPAVGVGHSGQGAFTPPSSNVCGNGWWCSVQEAWDAYTNKSLTEPPKDPRKIGVDANGNINTADFFQVAKEKFAESDVIGRAHELRLPQSVKDRLFPEGGTPDEWARFATQLCQQESSCRVAPVLNNGTLQRFPTTLPGEKSFGPLQFNRGEYGLQSWTDVNTPERTIDALINVAEANKLQAYFGSIQRPNELLQHNQWFEARVAPNITNPVQTASVWDNPQNSAVQYAALDFKTWVTPFNIGYVDPIITASIPQPEPQFNLPAETYETFDAWIAQGPPVRAYTNPFTENLPQPNLAELAIQGYRESPPDDIGIRYDAGEEIITTASLSPAEVPLPSPRPLNAPDIPDESSSPYTDGFVQPRSWWENTTETVRGWFSSNPADLASAPPIDDTGSAFTQTREESVQTSPQTASFTDEAGFETAFSDENIERSVASVNPDTDADAPAGGTRSVVAEEAPTSGIDGCRSESCVGGRLGDDRTQIANTPHPDAVASQTIKDATKGISGNVSAAERGLRALEAVKNRWGVSTPTEEKNIERGLAASRQIERDVRNIANNPDMPAEVRAEARTLAAQLSQYNRDLAALNENRTLGGATQAIANGERLVGATNNLLSKANATALAFDANAAKYYASLENVSPITTASTQVNTPVTISQRDLIDAYNRSGSLTPEIEYPQGEPLSQPQQTVADQTGFNPATNPEMGGSANRQLALAQTNPQYYDAFGTAYRTPEEAVVAERVMFKNAELSNQRFALEVEADTIQRSITDAYGQLSVSEVPVTAQNIGDLEAQLAAKQSEIKKLDQTIAVQGKIPEYIQNARPYSADLASSLLRPHDGKDVVAAESWLLTQKAIRRDLSSADFEPLAPSGDAQTAWNVAQKWNDADLLRVITEQRLQAYRTEQAAIDENTGSAFGNASLGPEGDFAVRDAIYRTINEQEKLLARLDANPKELPEDLQAHVDRWRTDGATDPYIIQGLRATQRFFEGDEDASFLRKLPGYFVGVPGAVADIAGYVDPKNALLAGADVNFLGQQRVLGGIQIGASAFGSVTGAAALKYATSFVGKEFTNLAARSTSLGDNVLVDIAGITRNETSSFNAAQRVVNDSFTPNVNPIDNAPVRSGDIPTARVDETPVARLEQPAALPVNNVPPASFTDNTVRAPDTIPNQTNLRIVPEQVVDETPVLPRNVVDETPPAPAPSQPNIFSRYTRALNNGVNTGIQKARDTLDSFFFDARPVSQIADNAALRGAEAENLIASIRQPSTDLVFGPPRGGGQFDQPFLSPQTAPQNVSPVGAFNTPPPSIAENIARNLDAGFSDAVVPPTPSLRQTMVERLEEALGINRAPVQTSTSPVFDATANRWRDPVTGRFVAAPESPVPVREITPNESVVARDVVNEPDALARLADEGPIPERAVVPETPAPQPVVQPTAPSLTERIRNFFRGESAPAVRTDTPPVVIRDVVNEPDAFARLGDEGPIPERAVVESPAVTPRDVVTEPDALARLGDEGPIPERAVVPETPAPQPAVQQAAPGFLQRIRNAIFGEEPAATPKKDTPTSPIKDVVNEPDALVRLGDEGPVPERTPGRTNSFARDVVNEPDPLLRLGDEGLVPEKAVVPETKATAVPAPTANRLSWLTDPAKRAGLTVAGLLGLNGLFNSAAPTPPVDKTKIEETINPGIVPPPFVPPADKVEKKPEEKGPGTGPGTTGPGPGVNDPSPSGGIGPGGLNAIGGILGNLLQNLFGKKDDNQNQSGQVPLTQNPSTPNINIGVGILVPNPSTVPAGGTSQLSWSSVGTLACAVSYPEGGAQKEIARGGADGKVETPALFSTTQFSLSCATSGSNTVSAQTTVAVATSSPGIVFVAKPATVASGNTAELSWSTVGTKECEVLNADDSVLAKGGRSGSTVSPALATTTQFRLSCSPLTPGSASKSAALTVLVATSTSQ